MIGGEGIYTFTLADALSDLGHNVTVITSDIGGGAAEYSNKNNFDLKRLSLSRIVGPKLLSFHLKAKKKIKEIYNYQGIDIVHYTNDVMFLSHPIDDLNIPIISTVHHPWAAERKFFRKQTNFLGYLRYAWGKKIYYLEWLEKKICENSDRIMAVSNYTAKSIINEYQISSKKVAVVPNAVDTKRFNPNVDCREVRERLSLLSEPIVLYVGKLDYHKGVEYLIKGFASVVKDFPDAKLVIVGDGPTRKNTEYLLDTYKLRNSVIFIGRVSDEDLPKYYAASDLVVLPSLMEGFGIVLLEAMACGKPCVATKVGGTEEAVVNNETGLIVPPADQNSIYNAIRTLLLDKNLSKKFGKNGRKRVLKNFTPDRVAIQTVNLYKDML
jgi:glycosyltransferase involved in cell wall biosynthesis